MKNSYKENNYETTNYRLACYLFAKKIKLLKVEKINECDPKDSRCKFVFEKEDNDIFQRLLYDWLCLKTDEIRNVLIASTELKKEIKYELEKKRN